MPGYVAQIETKFAYGTHPGIRPISYKSFCTFYKSDKMTANNKVGREGGLFPKGCKTKWEENNKDRFMVGGNGAHMEIELPNV